MWHPYNTSMSTAPKFPCRAAKRKALTQILATLAKAQKHRDRMPLPDQPAIDLLKDKAVEDIVEAFAMDRDETDARSLASAQRFTAALLEAAQRRYSVAEKAFYAEVSAMDAAMVEAIEASSAARFSTDKALEAKEASTAHAFYEKLGKEADLLVQMHGSEFILKIAKEDLARVQGKLPPPNPK